jgi:hypothetical protein
MIRPQAPWRARRTPRHPLDRGEDVAPVQRLGPRRTRVAERRVEHAAAADLGPPRHRVAVDGRHDVRGRARPGVEAIPLVAARPAPREALGGRVALHDHVLALQRPPPVVAEAGAAQELAVERPVAIRVGGRVDRHDAAAGPHPALEGRALRAPQHARTVRLEQDDDVDVAEVLEGPGVVGDPGTEAILERGAPGIDRFGVAVRGRAREDQHLGLRLVAAASRRDREREHRGANPHGRRCYAGGGRQGSTWRR